ncbi:MAG: cob(I)yrinic acid a,c-diamide adenosyltransferase [Pseudomonadota bacterium]
MTIRLSKIYTKVGDRGSTLLATGERVLKSNDRIEAYGTVDELNSFVGVLRDSISDNNSTADLLPLLARVQNELFDVGGELSVPLDVLDTSRQQVIQLTDVERLEREMDAFNEKLPPLENFVLPGGHLANSNAHVVRTVCRRAERAVVRMSEQAAVRDEIRIYLNRLSDWFFVLSRELSRRNGVEEVLWAQNKKI